MRNGLQDSGVNSYSYQAFTFCREQKNNKAQCQQRPVIQIIDPCTAGGSGAGGPVVSERVEVQVYKYERCSQNNSSSQQKCSTQQKNTKCERSRLAAKQNKCKKFGISGSISKTRNFGKRNCKNQNAESNCPKFTGCRAREPTIRKLCRQARQQQQHQSNIPDDTQLALEKAMQYLPIENGGPICCKLPESNNGDWSSKYYSSSARYQQPSSSGAAPGTYPFEADYQQPLPQAGGATNYANYQQTTYTTPQLASYPPQQQTVEYRTVSQPISQPLSQAIAQSAASNGIPSYTDQLQQMNESYQQEQLQAQMQAQQQQRQQEQLLIDLYKQTPQGQGRAVTDSPGRSQAFYTADQYINFLNRQHQDVFSQQQNQSDRGYQFSPMSAYTNGVPATTAGQGVQYSPASNVSHVNYTNGKLSYNF